MWKLEDIVDLNYFSNNVKLEEDLSEEELHQRDRNLFLEHAAEKDCDVNNRQRLLRIWLTAIRQSYSESAGSASPGIAMSKGVARLRFILVFMGVLLGITAGLSYFVYSGKTPLNVFSFFSLFILPQLMLLVVLIFRSLIAGIFKRPLSNLTTLLLPLAKRFTFITAKTKESKYSDYLSKLAGGEPVITGQSILFYPLFIIAQLFGIGFNLGLAALTSLKIITSDLAFGWQTTLQIGPEKLYSLVKTIALPWSWLLSNENGYPSLSHIEGSRIILKEGIYNLATENLVAWWPFLLASLLVYGLLPRVVLFLAGVLLQHTAFKRNIKSYAFTRICERMVTPLVKTQAPPLVPQADTSDKQQQKPLQTPATATKKLQEAILVVPADIDQLFQQDDFVTTLTSHGYRIAERVAAFTSYESDQKILETLSTAGKSSIIMIEAWMAPINEHLQFIEDIAKAATQGENTVAVCLLGKPTAAGKFTLPTENDVQLWQEKLSDRCDTIEFIITSAAIE